MSEPQYPWRKPAESLHLRSHSGAIERTRKRADERESDWQPGEGVREIPIPRPELYYVTSTDCRVCGKKRPWRLARLWGFGIRRHCGQCGAEYCLDCFRSLPIDYADPSGGWWIVLCAECDGETVDFYRAPPWIHIGHAH